MTCVCVCICVCVCVCVTCDVVVVVWGGGEGWWDGVGPDLSSCSCKARYMCPSSYVNVL